MRMGTWYVTLRMLWEIDNKKSNCRLINRTHSKNGHWQSGFLSCSIERTDFHHFTTSCSMCHGMGTGGMVALLSKWNFVISSFQRSDALKVITLATLSSVGRSAQ